MSSFASEGSTSTSTPPPPPTDKVYLTSTLLFTHSSDVLSLSLSPEVKFGSHLLILRSTIFHPQGGGQPSDLGTVVLTPSIRSAAALSCASAAAAGLSPLTFTVSSVRAVGDVVHHFGSILELPASESSEEASLSTTYGAGARADLFVDVRRRLAGARLHSFGHLLDAAMHSLGYLSATLKATKGYHFEDGPYVEYEGVLPSSTSEAALPLTLNDKIKSLVAAMIPTAVSVVPRAEAEQMCGGEGSLSGYPDLVRVVTLGGFNIPCGGTHVPCTSFLQGITVTKAKGKKKVFKISYEFDEAGAAKGEGDDWAKMEEMMAKLAVVGKDLGDE